MRFCFFCCLDRWTKSGRKWPAKILKKTCKKISFFIFFRHINCIRKKSSETTPGGGRKKIEKNFKNVTFLFFFCILNLQDKKTFKYAIWTKTRTSKNPGNGAGNTLTTISSYFIKTIPDCVWEKRKRFDCIVKQEKSKKNERER